MTPTMLSFAVLMVGVSVIIVVWFHRYRVVASAKRMMGMMARIGLDPAAAMPGGPQTESVTNEMRRRCRNCPREDLCDRWLAGKVTGPNTFCPNAQTFDVLT
jgi:hypothetical protein